MSAAQEVDRCPLKVLVTERMESYTAKVLLPCALSHGHKGSCLAEVQVSEQHFYGREK